MPVFYILVVLGAIALWFLLPFLFKPLGRLFVGLWNDAVNVMTEEDINEK